MEIPVELLALNCIQCGMALPAELDEVAWVCSNCTQGQQLAQNGLIPLEIHSSARIPANQTGWPFWIATGRATIDREVYGTFGKKTEEARDFWAEPHLFIVPAFDHPLQELIQTGMAWLRNPPDLTPGPPAAFQSVTVSPEDMGPWAEFLVLAVEASRKDKVKKIQFSLDLDEPELWVLPAGA
jgi:hypothetical protein